LLQPPNSHSDYGLSQNDPHRFLTKEKNMTIYNAVYSTVHDYKGGSDAIATAININKQTLINKVNKNNSTHHITLDEALRLMKFTKDTQIIETLAEEMGGIFIPTSGSDDGIAINEISKLSIEFGSLIQEVAKDICDNKISDNELARIQKESNELKTAINSLMRTIKKMHEDSKK
jgi:hypothetical protein